MFKVLEATFSAIVLLGITLFVLGAVDEKPMMAQAGITILLIVELIAVSTIVAIGVTCAAMLLTGTRNKNPEHSH